MDIIDLIEVPSFERRRDRFKRGLSLLTGTAALLIALEKAGDYKLVTKASRAVYRGMSAAMNTWLEDRSGTRPITMTGNAPPPVTNSALELYASSSARPNSSHLGSARGALPPASHEGARPAASAAVEAAGQAPVVVTRGMDVARGGGTAGGTAGGTTGSTAWPSNAASRDTSYTALNYMPGEALHGQQAQDENITTPAFFQSTKFFAVLDVDEARELHACTNQVLLQPHEVLFRAGEPSDSGIFIVVMGQLGVFLPDPLGINPPVHVNSLRYGESVGDLDVVDGAPRSVMCIALDGPCVMVQLPRTVFLKFVGSHPHALLSYLQQGLARLWRVAHFTLTEFLAIELHKPLRTAKSYRRHVFTAAGTETGTQTEEPPGSGSGSGAQHTQPMTSVTKEGAAAADLTNGTELASVLPTGTEQTDATPDADGTGASGGEGEATAAIDLFTSTAAPASAGGAEVKSRTGSPGGIPDNIAEESGPAEQRSISEPGTSADQGRTEIPSTAAAPSRNALPSGSLLPPSSTTKEPSISEPSSTARQSSTSAQGRAAAAPRNGTTHVRPAPEGQAGGAAAGAHSSDEGEQGAQHAGASTEVTSDRVSLEIARPVLGAPVTGAHGQGGRQTEDAVVQAGLQAAAVKLTVIQRQQQARQEVQQNQHKLHMPDELLPSGPVCRINPSATLLDAFKLDQIACLADGWDVVDVEELSLGGTAWSKLTDPRQTLGTLHPLLKGGTLQEPDWACGQFYLLLSGHLLAERQVPSPNAPIPPSPPPGTTPSRRTGGWTSTPEIPTIAETAVIRPGSAISCAAFLSYTASHIRVVALEDVKLLGFGWPELMKMMSLCDPPRPPPPANHHATTAGGLQRAMQTTRGNSHISAMGAGVDTSVQCSSHSSASGAAGGTDSVLDTVLLPLLLAAGAAMGPVIRRFISLGLNRVWLSSGDVAYRQGDEATSLFVVISGRLRLVLETVHPVTGHPITRVEEELGRGEAVGVVWAIAGGHHDTTALCVRDSELVRMSKAAFTSISEESPIAMTRLFNSMARRLVAAWDARMRSAKVSSVVPRSMPSAVGLTSAGGSKGVRGEVVVIAVVPAGIMPAFVGPMASGVQKRPQAPGVLSLRAVKRLAAALKDALQETLAPSTPGDVIVGPNGETMAPPRSVTNSVILYDSTRVGLLFPTAMEKLEVQFYRTKITSWLSNQEEEARFIILEADLHASAWSSVCVAQADVILLVAAEGAQPALSQCEAKLVFGMGSSAQRSLASFGGSHVATNKGLVVETAHPPTMEQLLGGSQFISEQASTEQSFTGPSVPATSAPALAPNPHAHRPPLGPSGLSRGARGDILGAPLVPAVAMTPTGSGGLDVKSSGPSASAPGTIVANGKVSVGASSHASVGEIINVNPLIAAANAAAAADAAASGRATPIPPAGSNGSSFAAGMLAHLSMAGLYSSHPQLAGGGLSHNVSSYLNTGSAHPSNARLQPFTSGPSCHAVNGSMPATQPGSPALSSHPSHAVLEAARVPVGELLHRRSSLGGSFRATGSQHGAHPPGQSWIQTQGLALASILNPSANVQETQESTGTTHDPALRTGRVIPTPKPTSRRQSMDQQPQKLSSAQACSQTPLGQGDTNLVAEEPAASPGMSRRESGVPDAAPAAVNGASQGLPEAGAGAVPAPHGVSAPELTPGIPPPARPQRPSAPAAAIRRVELVLLHDADGHLPQGTAKWLSTRPNLTRHHHVRLSNNADLARVARWMCGRAVGLVLSGGGSRGLAHMGVLSALQDAGVPVDVIGGTSQGAFMAGLSAQRLPDDQLQDTVRDYAQRMGSFRHLFADLTLPILSLFTGRGFDETLQKVFSQGAEFIEDLWLPFFCLTTNISRGEPQIHTQGQLWRFVRASMTIVGLLPPICADNGDLLVDGGYLNNMPVDIMRGMGVETVIVVDVEGRDELGLRGLTPFDGGLSGWRLLWERWCPFSKGTQMPRYARIVNELTWMSHAYNLRRIHEDYRIDLYLRPPNISSFKLMDYHLMDRIVQDAHRYATLAISQWPLLKQVTGNVSKGNPRASMDEDPLQHPIVVSGLDDAFAPRPPSVLQLMAGGIGAISAQNSSSFSHTIPRAPFLGGVSSGAQFRPEPFPDAEHGAFVFPHTPIRVVCSAPVEGAEAEVDGHSGLTPRLGRGPDDTGAYPAFGPGAHRNSFSIPGNPDLSGIQGTQLQLQLPPALTVSNASAAQAVPSLYARISGGRALSPGQGGSGSVSLGYASGGEGGRVERGHMPTTPTAPVFCMSQLSRKRQAIQEVSLSLPHSNASPLRMAMVISGSAPRSHIHVPVSGPFQDASTIPFSQQPPSGDADIEATIQGW